MMMGGGMGEGILEGWIDMIGKVELYGRSVRAFFMVELELMERILGNRGRTHFLGIADGGCV